MSKHPQAHLNAPIPKSSLNFLEEGQFVEWFSKNGKYLTYALLGLLALLIVFYRYGSSQAVQTEQSYIQAANDFAVFKAASNDSTKASEALKQLESLMKKHPELHAAYDGGIAQTLLNRGLASDAKPYAEATLARTRIDDLPYYSDFGATTLLIASENYEEALDKSQAMQQQMSDIIGKTSTTMERSFGDELFALNLFRIAMLQQQLGDKAGELNSWRLWKHYAGLEKDAATSVVKIDTQVFRGIIQQLAVGSLSLPDYISYRENALKK